MTYLIFHRALWLSLLLFISLVSVAAQNRRPNTPRKTQRPTVKEPLPTYDTLLASGTFKIYGEIRGAGQLISSAPATELLDTFIKFGSPGKEFSTLVNWLNAHAGELNTSRVLLAGWPNRPQLPVFICAFEFATEEEAAKFEPKLTQFLPKLISGPNANPAATPAKGDPSATPEASPDENDIRAASAGRRPYYIKRAGNLIVISESQFTFPELRPANSKLLRDDERFRMVRNRLNVEPVFLFVDLKTDEQNMPKTELRSTVVQDGETPELAAPDMSVPAPMPPLPVEEETLELPDNIPAEPPTENAQQQPPAELTPAQPSQPPVNVNLWRLGGFPFEGPGRWPEAIGFGAAFELDDLVVRAFVINSDENKTVLVPFLPQISSGPPLLLSTPSVLPADAEIYVSMSVDFGLMHDQMVKASQRRNEARRRYERVAKEPAEVSPFEAFEKQSGIVLKRDLIPLLGNEVGITINATNIFGTAEPVKKDPADPTMTASPASDRGVVVAISVRDREGMRQLLPKIVDSLGIKGASLLAQTERREDTELVSYANYFAYAFVGDFLVVSTDAKAVRHTVDEYLSGHTLGADSNFHAFTRWQPRLLTGQVYVSSNVQRDYYTTWQTVNSIKDEKLREFIGGLMPMNVPITYALTNEGQGSIHEVHLPRKLLLLMMAGLSNDVGPSAAGDDNEASARLRLTTISAAQEAFKASKGNGSYGSLEQLLEAGLLQNEWLDTQGYKIFMINFGAGYEAHAVPNQYGKTGKRSFFMDQSGIVRSGDHGGAVATSADTPDQ